MLPFWGLRPPPQSIPLGCKIRVPRRHHDDTRFSDTQRAAPPRGKAAADAIDDQRLSG